MNKNVIKLAAIAILSTSVAYAGPFSDVPTNHWAYDAISQMAEKGIIQGFPDGTYKGKQNVTRYQLAMMTAKMLSNIEQNGMSSIAKNDLQTLEKLTVEFADELALLGVKVTALEDDMQTVKEDVAGLKQDVSSIKESIKNGSLDKVRLSGDILIRNYGFVHDRGSLGNVDFGEDHRHRTETGFRLQLDSEIDENVSARARWNLIGNNGLNDWDGNNKGTAEVEIAYIKIKDLFSFGGEFKFGRDWCGHGHRFVVYNYSDVVNFTKKCGEVDMALNLFFDRQGNKDYYNVWNLNADYNYKGHNLYFGFYFNERAYDENGNALADNRKETRYEFGSSGKLNKKQDKFSYDLAFVYSDIEDGNGAGSDAQGLLSHIAFKYDSKKQFTAKIAYTRADDESNSNVNVENLNDFVIGDETAFEDLYLCTVALNGNDNQTFKNMTDLKLQVGYTLKNDDRHKFRLAYDHLENVYDGKANTFNTVAGNPLVGFINDLKGDVITFAYTYQLSEHTRLKICYQNSKVKACDMPDQKVDLYFTEIFSTF
ncbi:MAG: S-layer homology domain-containing protein [Candidatus Riflebacteria bacterium]|nr:S-layer homology domain-containing protein [Candidatus Riflebacteria bacterium]